MAQETLDRRAACPHRLLALCERFPPRLPPLVPVVEDGGGFGTTGPRTMRPAEPAQRGRPAAWPAGVRSTVQQSDVTII